MYRFVQSSFFELVSYPLEWHGAYRFEDSSTWPRDMEAIPKGGGAKAVPLAGLSRACNY